jgi:ribose 5-phosphate isomerase B
MEVIFGSDHGGFELKEALKAYISSLGYEVTDVGAHTYEPGDDYPVFVQAAIEELQVKGSDARAIVLGGSGQGEAMVANRYDGVRACLYYADTYVDGQHIVAVSRQHNDSNVLSIGARFVDIDNAKAAVRLWLETSFSGDERHVRRLSQFS